MDEETKLPLSDGPQGMELNLRNVFLILVIVWAGVYLPALGTLEFRGEEAHRTLPAVTMIESGDWAMPYIAGEPYFNKPPGINWLVAASYLITGQQNEWSSRLVSVVFILLFITMLTWMRSGFLSVTGKCIAGIVFLTAVSLIEKGRLIEIETVYICLTGMACLWWINVWSRGGSAWALWAMPAVLLAYGNLTKGPLILGFFYAMVIPVAAYSKKWKSLLSVPHVLAIAFIIGTNYLWAYLGPMQYSQDEMSSTLFHDMVIRLLPKSWGYWGGNIVEALVAFLPWTLALPALWDRRLVQSISAEQQPLFKGLRLGFVIGFVGIMILPRTETRYVLPVFALGSIALGWALSMENETPPTAKFWRIMLGIGFVLAALAGVAGLIRITTSIWAWVTVVAAWLVGIVVMRKRGQLTTVLNLTLATAALVVVLMLEYSAFYVTAKLAEEKFRPTVAAVHEIVGPEETIYIYRSEYETWLYYIRKPFEHLHETEQVDRDVRYLIVEKIRREELEQIPEYRARHPRTLYEYDDRIKGHYRLIELDPGPALPHVEFEEKS